LFFFLWSAKIFFLPIHFCLIVKIVKISLIDWNQNFNMFISFLESTFPC